MHALGRSFAYVAGYFVDERCTAKDRTLEVDTYGRDSDVEDLGRLSLGVAVGVHQQQNDPLLIGKVS